MAKALARPNIMLLIALWAVIYLAFTFERPGVGQGPAISAFVMSFIPVYLTGGLYTYKYSSKYMLWRPFSWSLWKPLALAGVLVTPLLDLLFKYTSLTSPILPGTFTSAGLMGITMLLVWYKFPRMSYKVFAIGLIAAFLMMYISELEYLTRFTIHFWQQPVSGSDTWIEFRRVPLVLIPCILVFARLRVRPTKYTWILTTLSIALLAVIWQSQYFLMYWNGEHWAANDIDVPIFLLNRVAKLLFMGIVVSLDYTRSIRYEELLSNQPLQHA